MHNVLQYLEITAQAYPQKTAVACREESYTFEALIDTARRLAPVISDGRINQPVGVFCDRSVDPVVLFLAVLYSGSYYVPMDPDMPVEKLQAVIDDAGLAVILGNDATAPLLSRLDYHGRFFTLADAGEAPCAFPSAGGSDPLYMVYTSGSTGKPKGVLKSHSAFIDFIDAYRATFEIGPEEIIGNQTPLFFDAAAKDFYLMLAAGTTMEIIPTELFAMPPMLIEYLNDRKISFLSWVPTALSIVAQLRTFSYILPETLKQVFFVGEVMPMKHLNYWRRFLPELRCVNLYGSSEIAGVCSWYEVTGAYDDADTLPMGKPLRNCRLYLLDGDTIVTQPEQIGELYIVSDALALEYYHDPEKTAACFLTKDFGQGPVRCYKTGDLAKYDARGNLVFASRTDFQIKHMGHRIELGEIETVSGALEEIERCCCLYDQRKKRIVLFCQCSEGSALTGREIQSLLRSRLSSYMLPSAVRVLDALPLNANGKIDRQKLKESL